MDVREKLVELLHKGVRCPGVIDNCNDCPYYSFEKACDEFGATVDLLIANGVTVQEWISVEEHLPQENEPEGAICEQVQVLLDNGVVSTGWCNRRTKLWWHLNYGETDFTGCDYEHTPVIAWKPLAQPPKGE